MDSVENKQKHKRQITKPKKQVNEIKKTLRLINFT